jgi:DNA polymerase
VKYLQGKNMLVPVYDIVNCGPRRRFAANGKLVHNSESVNLQNIPSRDKKKKALKNALIAPPGHVIINSDSSQIEARVLAWLAKQDDVVEQFRNNQDVYSIFASKIYKKEISKANPIERFVGKTCVLGLGFGTGAMKLRHTLKTQPPGADLTEEECKRIVSIYRETNYRITELWQECEHALDAMIQGVRNEYSLMEGRPVHITKSGIRLPNGFHIHYPNLRFDDDKRIYDSRKGPISIWGGYVVENVVQALARIIVAEQMLKMETAGYRSVLTVHDAAVCVVKESDIDKAVADITAIMSTPPFWAYGEC